MCHRIQKEHIRTSIKILFGIWYTLAFVIPYIIPVFSLPKPKGESFVGTETFHWTDSTREEWFTIEKADDFREIMVQSWYPSDITQNKKVEPYMDFIELRSKTIANAGGLPSFLPSHLNLIRTNSYSEVPCKIQKGGLPVIIFSHGITGSRHLHQALFEHLSSRGYIVIALDHSYDSNLTVFPDGRIADYRSELTGHPDSVQIRENQINTRVQDIIFILNQLTKIQNNEIRCPLSGNINLEKMAIGGHSFGGATAIQSTKVDKRIQACFVFDGWINPVPDQTIKSGLRKPFLLWGGQAGETPIILIIMIY